jgi:hypothetical protein
MHYYLHYDLGSLLAKQGDISLTGVYSVGIFIVLHPDRGSPIEKHGHYSVTAVSDVGMHNYLQISRGSFNKHAHYYLDFSITFKHSSSSYSSSYSHSSDLIFNSPPHGINPHYSSSSSFLVIQSKY